jgi:hypothetical protein
VPVAPAPKIADPVEEPPAVEETNSKESDIKEKPVPEVEATANQQSEESPPLESEPTQDKSTLPVPVAPAPKIADPVEEPPAVEETNSRESGIKEKPVPEVEATANQQPEESPPLESEPTQDKSTLPSPSVQGVIPHISGGTVEEETEESVEEKELEGPDPKMQTSNTPPAPVQLAPTFKQNPRQETSPQRSKEVQAYLNFIEDTGNKFVELVKEGWHRLLAMISQQ